MERLNYSEIVMQIVKEHYQYHTQDSQYETQLILDSERNHYLLISWRWQNEQRDYGCSIHVDIKDGKIWIQQDFTEQGIAQQLLDLGVPKSDIVLAFRSPFVRQFYDFAVN
ncbi:MAG: XisI protein [Okeania sp. SIO3I5]|uniref:XisI protein n=1 Tax=Okeania sp. SIO3I5 TaxID=2607805 RepID=UPI0013BC9640|nr:XisI protein [Okeania sp. SIO3I5]NEQ35380.1 XisI protein [Okeania sp. SIO3I5]